MQGQMPSNDNDIVGVVANHRCGGKDPEMRGTVGQWCDRIEDTLERQTKFWINLEDAMLVDRGLDGEGGFIGN